ncbi:carbon monoxide dehydrogenase subunit G (CoxG) family protein [Planotetraspora silvatica]|uniref:Carbon monoxide dehydrogenase subunit G (CoxG) family protein n=1 Tax=Planotetraspora silvatica TaxID=234614 RepID=A0A8J3UFQ3_9ACTN|nr:SRPBCC family protein [Planotetraspora silvatica]GII44057.1 carbon monoxide dehydrogenase subunit G (CoxG) family protein [Planotetraspora silvatica]
MKITHDFTVSVPVERAWAVLTDLEAVAPCMPGAQLTGVEDGVYSGKVKVKVGPVVTEYAGTVRFAEKDDVNHHAVIDAKGRDSRGAGTAAAVITAQLTSEDDRTVVTVDTDLKISGRIAQFGSGMIKEVSQKLLGQFVERLEEKLAGDPSMAAAASLSPGGADAVSTDAGQHRAGAGQTGDGTATPIAALSGAPGGTKAAPVTADTAAAPADVESEPAARRVVAPEPEPLDVMSMAGGSVYKRAIPVLVVLIVVVGVAVYLLVS